MIQAFFENNTSILRYLLIWIFYALILSLTEILLTDLSFGMLIADALVNAFVLAFMGIAINSVLRFGNFLHLSVFQRIINYGALVLLVILISAGTSYLFESLVYENYLLKFVSLLPVKGFINMLVSIIIFLYLGWKLAEQEWAEPCPEEIRQETDLPKESDELKETLERIAVKIGQKIHLIQIPEIVMIQADGDYVHIFTMDGKYLKEQTMKYFEEHLPSSLFVRVHRSYIVNIEAISRIELYDKQNQQLTLKNGQQVKVSQNGFRLLKIRLSL